MDIVDTQVHVFLTIGGQEALAAMDALGIRSVIIDEFWGYDAQNNPQPGVILEGGSFRPMSPLAQAAAMRHPDRFSYLQRVRPSDPDLQGLFAILASSPGCRSVRIDLREDAEKKALLNGGYDALFALAQRHGLPLDVLGADTAALLTRSVRAFPELIFVIDHCGLPTSDEHWQDVLALGSSANVMLKWIHAPRVFKTPHYPFPELAAPLRRAIDIFGIERIMWGSDFTANRTGHTWGELLFYIRDSANALSISDTEWLLAKTARKIYGWPITV
ncbi:MAG: amidohydrolase family protein [Janthinobacterium lividum]